MDTMNAAGADSGRSGEMPGPARSFLQNYVDRQREWITAQINHYRTAIEAAANALEEQNEHRVADTVRLVADKMDSATRYLAETEPSALVRDVRDFTRRHSTVILTGLFIGGLLLARLHRAQREQLDARVEIDEMDVEVSPIGVDDLDRGF